MRKSELKEYEIKAIELNQGIIERMAGNSQRTKTMFLALCAGVGTFMGSGSLCVGPIGFLWLSLLGFFFWIIDARYLQLERQFRAHHKALVSEELSTQEAWMFNPSSYKGVSLIRVMFSFSQILYPVMIVSAILFSCSLAGVFNPLFDIALSIIR
ncbi:MAG: hypothetical protein ACRCVN_04725 [Spirochaetia bacterium]